MKEAFSCLVSLAGTEPENSAQAECVKEALVSLKECSEASSARKIDGNTRTRR